MADPLTPSTLLVGLIGGAAGSVFTAWIGYMVQNRLAGQRRKEKEKSLAYVALVKISALVATTRLMRKMSPVAMSPPEFHQQVREVMNKTPGITEIQAICAFTSVMMTHEANGSMGMDSRQMTGFFMSMAVPQFERMSSDFYIGPTQLSELPQQSIETYALVAASLSVFGTALTQLSEYAKGGPEAIVSAQSLYGYWLGYDLMEKNAERLRKELVAHANLQEDDAESLLTRQMDEFSRNAPTSLVEFFNLDLAAHEFKSFLDAQAETMMGTTAPISSGPEASA